MQVGALDLVVVAEAQRADPGAREGERGRAPQAADPDEENASVRAVHRGPSGKYSSMLKYRSPVSGSTVTTFLPGPSSRATSRAT